ncbi:MAG: putative metal-binding motif-containing protein [Deltaproteobacteria bacterium]|nr:putative metal-binding motif-containing protein [Deltaproteobacteria bacterium]
MTSSLRAARGGRLGGVLGGALSLLAGACVFSDAVPVGAQLDCVNSADCPRDLQCLGLVGRCVDPASMNDSTPPAAVDIAVSAEQLSAADLLAVSFGVSEQLLNAPTVRAGDVDLTVAMAGDRYAVEVGAASLGPGFHPVTATLIDLSANAGVSVLAIVEVDVEPPHLIDGSVQWQTSPPPGVVPLIPTTLTLGSSMRLEFRIDDFSAPWPTVTALGPDGAALAFAPLDRVDATFSFTGAVDAPLPGGRYLVHAQLADLLGNTADQVVPLPGDGLVLGDIPEAPCIARRGDGSPACTDLDADGAFGPSLVCPSGTDCDDTRTMVHRGAVEVPGNGLDDDCDGVDTPLDETTAVFVAPSGRTGAPGTPDDPFASPAEAALAAQLADLPMVVLQRGSYQVDDTKLFASLAGGFDEQWRPTAERSELLQPGSGVLLDVGGGAPRRLEGLRISGTACGGIDVAGDPVTEIVRTEIVVRSAGCDPTWFPAGISAAHRLVLSHTVLDVDTTDTTGGGNGVTAYDDITVVDCDISILNGARALLGSTLLHRSRVSSIDAVSRGTAGVVCPVAPCIVAGSVVTTESAFGAGTAVVAYESGAVFHSVLSSTGDNEQRCVTALGLTIVNTLCRTGGTGAAIAAESAAVVALGLVPPTDACVIREPDGTCWNTTGANTCAFSGCVEAHDNAAVASLSDVMAGVPALDYGAPTSTAMDADGDCRGALGVEAGADELP